MARATTIDLSHHETVEIVSMGDLHTTAAHVDIEMIRCLDGKGRSYQTRTRIEDGRYQVTLRDRVIRWWRPGGRLVDSAVLQPPD